MPSAEDSSEANERLGKWRKVGRYELFEEIGAGGMGVVFRGFDPELRRPVALKRVHPERAEAEAVRRLRREARAVARLNHPAVTQIYDIIEPPDGTLWIVLELVRGRSIPQLQKERPVPFHELVGYFRQVAEGLDAAHRQGLLHRDLKHENVLVALDGEGGDQVGDSVGGPVGGQVGGKVKVLDFGLALDLFESGSSSEHGGLRGTGRAMSPEQVLGEPLDPRSDLFSLGVLIYEAVAGISPFKAEALVATLQRVLSHRQPSLDRLVPGTPTGLSELVDALLSKEPAGRPADAVEVIQRLDGLATEGSPSALDSGETTLPRTQGRHVRSASPGASKRRRLRRPLLGLALVMTALAALVPMSDQMVMGSASGSVDVIDPRRSP